MKLLYVLADFLLVPDVVVVAGVNVDYILCPPSSLPSFMSGPHYLLQCAWTQTLVIAGVHKTMTLAVRCLGRCVGHETYLYHYQVSGRMMIRMMFIRIMRSEMS